MKRVLSIMACLLMVFCIATISFADDHQSNEARRVRQIAMSGDRQVLAAVYDELGSTIIDLFDANTMELLETVDVAPSIPSQIALSPNGERVLLNGPDSTGDSVYFYDRETDTYESVFPGIPDVIGDIAWNPNTSIVAFSLGIGIYIHDTDTDQVHNFIESPFPAPAVSGIGWSWDGRYLASSHFNRAFDGERLVSAGVWDTDSSDNIIRNPEFIDNTIGGGSIRFSPDGQYIALLNIKEENNRQLLIYDLDANVVDHTISYNENSPVFEWSPDGQFLAVGDDTLQIFDTATWEIAQTIVTERPVLSLHWSLDGARIFHNGTRDGIAFENVQVEG